MNLDNEYLEYDKQDEILKQTHLAIEYTNKVEKRRALITNINLCLSIIALIFSIVVLLIKL